LFYRGKFPEKGEKYFPFWVSTYYFDTLHLVCSTKKKNILFGLLVEKIPPNFGQFYLSRTLLLKNYYSIVYIDFLGFLTFKLFFNCRTNCYSSYYYEKDDTSS